MENIKCTIDKITESNKNDILTIKKLLRQINVSEKYSLTFICAYSFNIGVEDMFGINRSRDSCIARYMNWFILKKYYGLNSPAIAELFSLNSHSIISKGIASFSNMLRINLAIKYKYKSVCDIFEYILKKNGNYK